MPVSIAPEESLTHIARQHHLVRQIPLHVERSGTAIDNAVLPCKTGSVIKQFVVPIDSLIPDKCRYTEICKE